MKHVWCRVLSHLFMNFIVMKKAFCDKIEKLVKLIETLISGKAFFQANESLLEKTL